jgi:mycothiol synthase
LSTTLTLKLELAAPADYDVMVDIQNRSAKHLGDSLSFIKSDLVAMATWTRIGLRGIFVIRDENEIVGHLRLVRYLDATPAHIVAFVTVDPEFRDSGIAHWTYEQIVETARNENATALDTVVDSRDRLARVFLDRLGFESLVTIKTLEADPDFAPGQAPQTPIGYSLRSYRPGEDAALLTELYNKTFLDHVTTQQGTVEETRSIERTPAFDPELTVFLESDPGIAVGYARTTVRHEAKDAWIDILGVLPEYQGRGLGRFLLLRCMFMLAQTRPKAIRLTVEATNEKAFALYESEGFLTHRTRLRSRKSLVS